MVACQKTLIRGATVLTMAPGSERPAIADVLIEKDVISEIGVNLTSSDAEIVDGNGRIVMPGLVNAHIHSWQSAFRSIAYNWHLLEYLENMHFKLAPHYKPEDIYAGTLAGALNQIACGTTTIGDWSHNSRTTAHVDAGLDALRVSGIRALYMPGVTPSGLKDQRPPSEIPYGRSDLERVLAAPAINRSDSLIKLGMAVTGPHYAPSEIVLADFRLAAEFGLVISMHHSGGPARDPDNWQKLFDEGLFDERTNIVHGNTIPDELLQMLVEKGVSFTITPEVEMGDGHGAPITGRLRDLGALPSLGVDIESSISGEMFSGARIALAYQRMLDHEVRRKLPESAPHTLTSRDALEWVTLGGARALQLEKTVGSLEPGKQADLIMVDTRAINLWPVHDPHTTVLQANPSNIEAVMIAGQWRKQDGHLLHYGLDRLQETLSISSQRILQGAGL